MTGKFLASVAAATLMATSVTASATQAINIERAAAPIEGEPAQLGGENSGAAIILALLAAAAIIAGIVIAADGDDDDPLDPISP